MVKLVMSSTVFSPHYRHDGMLLMSVTPHLIPHERWRRAVTADNLAERCRRDGGGNKGSCLLTELVRRQMKHEMSILHATQTYQVLYGEGTGGGGRATCVAPCKHSQTYR